MTPAEWDEHVRALMPRPLVEWVWPTAGLRRRRLFLIALHLRGGYEPADLWERHVVRIAEKAAGGYIGDNHLSRESAQAIRQVLTESYAIPGSGDARRARRAMAVAALIEPELRPNVLNRVPLEAPLRESGPDTSRSFDDWLELTFGLIGCVFGNPTRPVKFDPGWRTSTVVELARVIDARRAFHLLPVLADALDDAGCGEPAVIGHCRDDVTHARGCWVVDGVLGRP